MADSSLNDPWERPTEPEALITYLFDALETARHTPSQIDRWITEPFASDEDDIWGTLIKRNENVNLTIRYSRQTRYNKEKLNRELTTKPENALFDFWELQKKMGVVPFRWTQFRRNGPFDLQIGYRKYVLFFQSDTVGLAPPFEWRDQENFR
jgi:hypothetical protein